MRSRLAALIPLIATAAAVGCGDPQRQADPLAPQFAHHPSAERSAAQFIGRARGVFGTVGTPPLVVNINLADTGPLPSQGGSLDATVVNAQVDGVLTANLLEATTAGAVDRTDSKATTLSLVLTLGANVITADVLNAEASARCGPAGAHPVLSGNSEIVALNVNGVAIDVSGQPNQRVGLIAGELVINEQTTTRHSITVNALRVIVDNLANVVISSAEAGVIC
jgi:hypothetical protein